MPTPSRTPTPAPSAPADSRRRRPLLALLSGALLVMLGLCALPHGQFEEQERPAPTVATAVGRPAVASDVVPHGPHRHQEAEECGLDGAARTPAQAAHQPPAETATTASAGLPEALVRPQPPRRQFRTRIRRTGRTALVRTSRWRI
ncbi:hypothetical protein [Streptomyces afghaniensis]|uniref:hypothetical protein n=1 Tax=Streptomyces afghaniensis TaxID=66865 RepID=UPI00278393BD|nr:hypothetical protein [Streptomyces afghaniensis]MDQ1014179.1 hypothetical protein [Streptomyces afghaniensis]